MTVDNSSTAWLRKLVANGADPHLIVAWMRHEVARNPLAFEPLMTPDEVAAIRLMLVSRQVRAVFDGVGAALRTVTEAIRPITRILNAPKETSP